MTVTATTVYQIDQRIGDRYSALVYARLLSEIVHDDDEDDALREWATDRMLTMAREVDIQAADELMPGSQAISQAKTCEEDPVSVMAYDLSGGREVRK